MAAILVHGSEEQKNTWLVTESACLTVAQFIVEERGIR
mgnify:CR=1 FL=1